MSTKEIIERLSQSDARPRRTPAPEKETDGSEVQTRVGARVIRRRRVARKEPSKVDVANLKSAEAPPPAEATPAAPPVVEEPPAEVVGEPAPVEAEEPQAEAPEEAEPPPEVAPEPEPVVEEPPPEEEAPAPVPEEAPPEPVEAEAAPAEEAEPEAASAAEEPAAAVEEEAPAPAASPRPLVSGLPRADHSNAPQPRAEADSGATGLGKAVVKPPPGYDPNDPAGNLRRSRENSNIGGRRAPGTEQKVWRDERRPGSAPPAGEQRDDRGRTKDKRGGRKRRGRVEMHMDEIPSSWRRRRNKTRGAPKTPSPQAKAIKRRVAVDQTITVSNLAHSMSIKVGQVIKVLIGMGQMATANDVLDFDTAELVAAEFEHEVIRSGFKEDEHLIQAEDVDETLERRAPVVTIMGHVDHGKTTLLDHIRKARVAEGEAGGITQHMGAYQVERNGEKITFIDTPGHEAFTAMRARGAKVTDIVVLVVAADDGVMPQTIEAINHAKAAGVQLMVAVNKCDKEGANPDKVRQMMMEYELVPEEYGGETLFSNVSALVGTGVDDLLDNLLLLAEVGDYRANPERHAEGAVLEGRLERGRGPVATLLVQKGSLKKGEYLVLGHTWGRVRAMTDHAGKKVKVASPSMPVEVIGLNEVPTAGDDFVVVKSEKDAKALIENRREVAQRAALASRQRATLEDLYARQAEEGLVELKLVIKADVDGSLEALKHSFESISIEGARLKILHTGIGAVSESDVTLAQAYDAMIMGYNVRPDAKARQAAESNGIQIRTYKVIYEAIEEVQKGMLGLLAPTIEEEVIGSAQVRETFKIPKIGLIAGCMVADGKVTRNAKARLVRDGTMVWEGGISSLKRFKDDAKEVEKGYECGIGLENYNDVKVGDIIEAYVLNEVAPTL